MLTIPRLLDLLPKFGSRLTFLNPDGSILTVGGTFARKHPAANEELRGRDYSILMGGDAQKIFCRNLLNEAGKHGYTYGEITDGEGGILKLVVEAVKGEDNELLGFTVREGKPAFRMRLF